MKKIFTMELYGEKVELKIEFGTYVTNSALAVQLYCKPEYIDCSKLKDPYQELFSVVTVNLNVSDTLESDEQFVDENNLSGIGGWLVENGIATPTGKFARSSFCRYQAYKFNIPDEDRERLHLQ